MNYRRMGTSGLKLSEISLGAWVTFGDQIDDRMASDIVHAAVDHGVNYFDNADIYARGRAEIVMGQAIRDLPRESLVLSSKVFWPTIGRSERQGTVAQARDRVLSRLPQADGRGLPGPVLLPSIRRRDAGRGDRAGNG